LTSGIGRAAVDNDDFALEIALLGRVPGGRFIEMRRNP
jgi:hypothetical protein